MLQSKLIEYIQIIECQCFAKILAYLIYSIIIYNKDCMIVQTLSLKIDQQAIKFLLFSIHHTISEHSYRKNIHN